MRRVSLAVALFSILLAAVGLPAFAQSEGSGTSAKKEISLVGCLDAGDEEGYYVLETEEGEEVTVMGDEEIGKHIGHKVELTGHMEEMDDEPVLVATKIRHISADCDE